MRDLRVISSPGFLPYEETLEQQMKRVDELLSTKETPYVCHFLEHAHVLTKGRSFEEKHILEDESQLKADGVEILEVSRGGSVTYHGPGQLVVYLHIHLKELEIYLTQYLRDLEQWVIDALGDFDIDAGRRDGMTGVWVSQGKICAMGVAAKKYVTYHGIGLNVATNMDGFNWIVPCGLEGQAVASLDKVCDDKPTRQQVELSLLKHMPRWMEKLNQI